MAEALSPDNINVPGYLKVKTMVKGDVVKVDVECQRGFETFLATVDDLLSCMQATEKAVKVVKNRED